MVLHLLHPRKKNRKPLYQGRSHVLYEGPEPGTLIYHFKDEEGDVHPCAVGVINNRISEVLMVRLQRLGIETHLIGRLNMREQSVYWAQAYPFSVRIHNTSTSDLAARSPFEVGTPLFTPLIEFVATGHNTLVSEAHLEAYEWADSHEIDTIKTYALRAHDILTGLFLGIGIRLANIRLDFGKMASGEYMEHQRCVLIGTLSFDHMCLLDPLTFKELSRFEHTLTPDLYDIQEVANRLQVLEGPGPVDMMPLEMEEEAI